MTDKRHVQPGDRHEEHGFRALVEAHLDGGLTDETRDALERLLASDAALRRVFVEVCLQEQLTHRLLTPSGSEISLPGLEDAGGTGDVDASDDSSVMASLVEEALRARRLHEVEERAAKELYASGAKERELAARRAEALRAQREGTRWAVPQWAGWGSLAAALLLAVWVGMSIDRGTTNNPPQARRGAGLPARADSVASVRGSVDARWGTGNVSNHDFVAGETISLEAGLAEVVFGDGTTVILEGPVTFEPTGANGLRLVSGRLSASVPEQSEGFRVDTPDMVVTNRRAEFGVSAQPGAGSEAMAFRGEITVDTREVSGRRRGTIERVRAGSAAVADRSGIEVVRADSGVFVMAEEYDIRAAAVEGDAYSRWLAYSYDLRRDPGVVAYYTFDHRDASPRTLLNRAVRSSGRLDGTLGLDGDAMTLPRWVDGRFPGKQGLRFGAVGRERAKAVVIDGLGGVDLGDALTLAVWVRTPDAEASAGGGTLLSLRDTPVRHMGFQFSLFMKGDPYAETLQFGTGNELVVDHPNDNFVYSNPRPISASSWHLAVVVYEHGEATFYLDGQRISRTQVPSDALGVTRPGASLLLGTDPYMPNFNGTSRVEAFMGDIDEVVILDRAMRRDEINEMYEIGRPDQD